MGRPPKLSFLALEKGDSKLWSPLDALRELVRAIEAGEVKPQSLAVHWWEEAEGGNQVFNWMAANLTRIEFLALMDLAHHRLLNSWEKE